ncbi:MAG TPA: TlpA disulfide reductase family protein [Pirellulales bacterium]|nr:TlpA disulfide reductase family protein [Pirellulales bacterium]
MAKIFSAAVLSCSLLSCATLLAADSPTKPAEAKAANSVSAQLDQLGSDYSAAVKKLKAQALDASSDAAKQKIRKEYEDVTNRFMEACWKLVKIHPDDPTAFDVLVKLATECDNDKISGGAMELILKNQAKNPKIGPFCIAIAQSDSDNAEFAPFLKEVVHSNPDKGAQGMAALAQALLLKTSAANNADLKPADRDQILDSVETSLVDVVQKYGDVKLPAEDNEKPQTIAKMVKPFLFQLQHLRIGKVAPDMEGQDADGKRFKLSDYKGKVIVVDFWATWCGPCMSLVPHERELVARLQDKPFVFLGVNVDQDKQDLLDVIKDKHINWRNFWDGKSELVENWGIQYFPSIFVIDQKGVIRYKDVRGQAMDDAIELLLSEGSTPAKKDKDK